MKPEANLVEYSESASRKFHVQILARFSKLNQYCFPCSQVDLRNFNFGGLINVSYLYAKSRPNRKSDRAYVVNNILPAKFKSWVHLGPPSYGERKFLL